MRCSRCGGKFPARELEVFKGKVSCDNCIRKIKNIPVNEQQPGEIKCPYCGGWFKPIQQRPTSTGGNITRGTVFLPWGVVSAVKNKPFVQCPHCKMKIPQG